MNDYELSIQADKNKNFMSHMKSTNYKKYEFIKEYGITQYEDRTSALRAIASDIYYHFHGKKSPNITWFWGEYCRDLASTNHAFISFIESAAFSSTKFIMGYKQFMKLTELELRYNKYNDEHSRKDND